MLEYPHPPATAEQRMFIEVVPMILELGDSVDRWVKQLNSELWIKITTCSMLVKALQASNTCFGPA